MVSIVVASASSRSRGGGNGTPNPRCSRSNQPAPTPQNARPPESTSSVAACLARTPAWWSVTGDTSVPSRRSVSSAARWPSVTHGSGIGSHARADLRDLDEVVHEGQPGEADLRRAQGDVAQPRRRVLAPGEGAHLEEHALERPPAGRRCHGGRALWFGRRRVRDDVDEVPALALELAHDGSHPAQLGGEHGGRDRPVALGVAGAAYRRGGVQHHGDRRQPRATGPPRGMPLVSTGRGPGCRRRRSAGGRPARRRSGPAGRTSPTDASRSAGPLPTTSRSASEDTTSAAR